MVTKIWDSIATWFYYNSHRDYYHYFWEHENNKFGCDPVWNFWALRKALELLYSSKLLIPIKVDFNNHLKESIETKNLTIDKIFDKIIIEAKTKNHSSMTFSGFTILYDKEKEVQFENLVKFSCSINTGQFNLNVYSDCWVPIDLNDKLQIDLAEKNSPRLSKALKEIKDIGFDNVDPGEEADYRDELLPQHGFKIFLHDEALNYIDEKLAEEDIKIIEKYLWKNRHINPS